MTVGSATLVSVLALGVLLAGAFFGAFTSTGTGATTGAVFFAAGVFLAGVFLATGASTDTGAGAGGAAVTGATTV